MVRQGSGRIINIGSLTGFTPVPLRGIYSATKAAVMRLTDALRLELRECGVQVMLVAPGFIKSNARDAAHVSAAAARGDAGVDGNLPRICVVLCTTLHLRLGCSCPPQGLMCRQHVCSMHRLETTRQLLAHKGTR